MSTSPTDIQRSQHGTAAGQQLPEDQQALSLRLQELGPWFHNMEIGGVRTAPEHFLGDYPNIKWQRFAHAIPADLTGKTVLDIGCNGGFYSMEMKRRGAARVLGIDTEDLYLQQARFAADYNNLDIEFERMSVYEVDQLGERFDYVIFMGVLYHLRHPLLALDKVATVVGERMIFQSMLRGSHRARRLPDDLSFWDESVFSEPDFPSMYFIEKCYAGDISNWWIPNRSAAEAMLRSAGFELLEHPEDEVWVCKPDLRKIEKHQQGIWWEG